MATHTEILLVDDTDGSPAEGTVFFSLDGQPYEIDLSGKNAQALRGSLAAYVDAGRRVTGPKRRKGSIAGYGAPGRRVRGGVDADQRKLARAWAQANPEALAALGIGKVSDRGRLAPAVLDAYAKALRS